MLERKTRWSAGLLALSTLAGCTMAPKYERPEAPVPGQFSESAGGEQEVLGYDQFFREPRLQRLIALALEENRDLRIAKLNVEELPAQFRIQRAALPLRHRQDRDGRQPEHEPPPQPDAAMAENEGEEVAAAQC